MAKAEGCLDTYEHKSVLPEIVQNKEIRDMYNVSNEDLLKRYVGGFAPNPNESLNAKIWKIAPKKITPGSRLIVEIAANVATSTFNDGAIAYLQILKLLGVTVGYEANDYCTREDAFETCQDSCDSGDERSQHCPQIAKNNQKDQK